MSISIEQLRARSTEADNMIAALRLQIAEVRRLALSRNFVDEANRLRGENSQMEAEVTELKAKLIRAEVRNGVKQIPIPEKVVQNGEITTPPESQQPQVAKEPPKIVKETPKKAQADKPQKKGKENQAEGVKKEPKKVAEPAPGGEAEPDVSKLDLRVGLITNVKKHPDADSLYVEEVNLGEERPRTVVSGLVKFVPLEQMQNRMAVLLCNLKPAKMRGVTSEAMVMCASTPEKVEILNPPEGCVPGDRVSCDAFPGEPEKQLNPKKKIWEQVAPHLKTDEKCVATYKGQALLVKGKGQVVAPTLSNVQIK